MTVLACIGACCSVIGLADIVCSVMDWGDVAMLPSLLCFTVGVVASAWYVLALIA